MAISNYGELKQKLSRYLFNQRFLADYDDYTTMFEADANSRLRVLPMEAINVFQTVTGYAPLPPDYLAWRTVLWIRDGIPTSPTDIGPPYPGIEIDYVHPAYLRAPCDYREPRVFTIEGDQFRGHTLPDSSTVDVYEFHYYQKIPTLIGSDANTNWLLTAYPNAYLFGLMVEAAGHGRNAEMAQLYKARRDEVFEEIKQLYALTTGATSPAVRTAEYY